MRCPTPLALALATLLLGTNPALVIAQNTAGPDARRTPTDWRDQVLYFAMIDRFDDGDPANNDQGADVFDPTDGRTYSGGDLAGLTRRLDYIEGLGVTGLWITPPVANQWWDSEARFSGYHGYWASDFSVVDAHYGTLAEYKALAAGLHGRGMTLVQDIVVNHTGNFYAFDDWRADDPTHTWRRTRGSRPSDRPAQWPFSQNDPNDPAQRALSVYHWTPPIRDYTDEHQERRFELAGLDDLDTESPVTRRALRQAYGHWIREVGVDAFRVDTAFYVPPDFFVDFLHADDAEAPGVMRVARDAGKPTFHLFGEGWGIDKAFDDAQMRKIDAYQRVDNGIPAMIQFPLYGSFGEVFARGHATAELGWRIERTLAVHADPWRMPTFVDNHDVDRFLAGGNEAGLKQALLAMMTLPGIPVVYYGTEQGFKGQRDAMFAGGFGSGGRDHFDPASPLYRTLAAMVALRRAHPALSRGTPHVVAANAAGPGALAWTLSGDAEAERAGAPPNGERLLVALNTAEGESLLDARGLPPNARLVPRFAIDGEASTQRADASGRLTLALPARSGQVWAVLEGEAIADLTTPRLDIAALPEDAVVGDLLLAGTATCPGPCAPRLVVDGDLAGARPLRRDEAGRWSLTLPTDDFIDPAATHTVQLFEQASGAASDARTFRVQRSWALLSEVDDPEGDDAGPEGRYRYPSDPSYGNQASLDLRRARLFGSGGALAVELELGEMLATWNPANGFDHLALALFLTLPGQGEGAAALPLRNDHLPEGRTWHRHLRVAGWSNALFGSEGASAGDEGTSITPGARVSVDRAAGRVRFEFPAAALGRPETLSGLRVQAFTWDYDGGWRGLSREGGPFTFGGGDGANDPLWMDTMEMRVP